MPHNKQTNKNKNLREESTAMHAGSFSFLFPIQTNIQKQNKEVKGLKKWSMTVI